MRKLLKHIEEDELNLIHIRCFYILGIGYDIEDKVLRISFRTDNPKEKDIKDYYGVEPYHWLWIKDYRRSDNMWTYFKENIENKYTTYKGRNLIYDATI